jgi:hypothetical protein
MMCPYCNVHMAKIKEALSFLLVLPLGILMSGPFAVAGTILGFLIGLLVGLALC